MDIRIISVGQPLPFDRSFNERIARADLVVGRRLAAALRPFGLRQRRFELAPVVRCAKPPAGVKVVFEVDEELGRVDGLPVVVSDRPIQDVDVPGLDQIREQGDYIAESGPGWPSPSSAPW